MATLRTQTLALALFALWFVPAHVLGAVRVQVDTRIELVSIMCRLARFEEYQGTGIEAYDKAVDEHFGKYREHPSVEAFRRIRREQGFGYDQIIAIALLAEADSWRPRVQLDALTQQPTQPSWTDARSARELLKAIGAFGNDANARRFFRQHKKLYGRLEAIYSKELTTRIDLGWFDREFGARPRSTFTLIPALLTAGNSYGQSLVNDDGRTEIYSVIAVDQAALLEGGASIVQQQFGAFVHEIAHSYVNPWVDARASALESGAKRLFAVVEPQMNAIAYGTWQVMVYESLVRATTRRYMTEHNQIESLRSAMDEDRMHGFAWIPSLMLAMRNENDRALPRIAGVEREIINYFDSWGAGAGDAAFAVRKRIEDEELAAQRDGPQIQSLLPSFGSTDVDPDLSAIVIRFDRPMSPGYSIAGQNSPEIIGTPVWTTDKKTIKIAVKLKPGTRYRFSLNTYEFQAFRSADGEILAPRFWIFTTR